MGLQMIEFYLILSAVQPDLSLGIFWRLLIGTVVMLAFGYMGEAHMVNPTMGFVVGWLAGDKVNQYVKSSFNTMRLIVTAGWCIYPLGYFFGYLMGAVSDDALNLVYNLADFVNKIGFCLAIWQAAKADTTEKINKERLLGRDVVVPVACTVQLPSGV